MLDVGNKPVEITKTNTATDSILSSTIIKLTQCISYKKQKLTKVLKVQILRSHR